MLKLQIRTPRAEEILHFNQDRIIAGRTKTNDIVLNDEKSSRKQFRIERSDEGYRLVDLESANGTLINGKPTKSKILERGDVIEVGDCRVYVDDIVVISESPMDPAPVVPVVASAPVESNDAGERPRLRSARLQRGWQIADLVLLAGVMGVCVYILAVVYVSYIAN